MEIVLEAHAFGAVEATESFVSANLMLGGHLEGANRADLAIVLDGVDDSGETIQF